MAQIAFYDSHHSHSFTFVYLCLYFETKLYMKMYNYWLVIFTKVVKIRFCTRKKNIQRKEKEFSLRFSLISFPRKHLFWCKVLRQRSLSIMHTLGICREEVSFPYRHRKPASLLELWCHLLDHLSGARNKLRKACRTSYLDILFFALKQSQKSGCQGKVNITDRYLL